MTNAAIFSAFNGLQKLRTVIPAVTCLIIVSFFLIGGCNNDGSNQATDARTIGSIEGALVPALNKALNLREWQEGDPDGDLYLNGSRVASLSDAEKQAVNDAYNMGYLIGLTNAEIDHILDMHEVLGLNPAFADNGTLDLLAFSREFNVSGIRYFILRPYQDGPIPEDINLGRVAALDDWAQISSSAASLSQAELRETGGPSELTSLADSWSWTEHGTWTAAPSPEGTDFTPDLQVTLTGFARAWAVHSTANNNDFYYLRTNYVLTPISKLGQLGSVCNRLCEFDNPLSLTCLGPVVEADKTGVIQYSLNNFQSAFAAPDLNVIDFNPTTTTGEVTTSSSISQTFSENVSYSQDDGAEVGVSNSSTYAHSTSYESPAVTTTAEINIGPNMNSAEWIWSVGNSNVSTATFEPNFQWIWEGTPATRANGVIKWQQEFAFESFPYTCAFPVTTTFIPVLILGVPSPPLPKQCTANSDCGPGQVCATDLSPAICVAQPCDEMMLCPDSFQCMNEECQPSSG